MCGALSSLSCIMIELQLSKDSTNERQFELESMVLDKFMRIDLAAINALLIFPKQSDCYRRNLMGG